MKQRFRLASALLAACTACSVIGITPIPTAAATTVVISPDDPYVINNGVFEGWGTSLCWWANRVGYSDSLAQQSADLFYGDEGLRLNIARFNIGGGDNPSHTHITRTDSNMPGYTKYNNGNVEYDWSADANQRNVLMRAIKAAGDDMIVEMFSNSPPYYMTNSGCSTGNFDPGKNNLKDDCYDDFAAYLAEVCAHYQKEWGVQIQSVTPVNEPYTNYWGANSVKQEGCHFDIGNSESTIILELQKAMAARGLGDVIISASDETAIDTQIQAYNALSADAKNAVGRIDTHTYGGSKRTELKELALSAGKNLWMSEVDGGSVSGTNAGEMGAALWLAERICVDCNGLNPSAWILWQVIDNHISKEGYNGNKDKGMVNVNGGYWGTAVADHDNDTVILTKKYYAFGQYTRYIRPGMTMLNASGKTVAAYDPENGQLVLVVYNNTSGTSDVNFDLSQFAEVGAAAQTVRTSNTENWANAGAVALKGDVLQVSLPANSVTTYIIDGVKGGVERGEKIELNKAGLSGSDSWNNTASTSFDKAFDSDTNTYFDGVGGGWVQADLGAVYDITSIGYCPRKGYEYRCTDAMFMVSEDGEHWNTVYTIPNLPTSGMHYIRPQGGATGRYLRYQVPEGAPKNEYNKDNVYCCNIAEIEVYGKPSVKANLTQIPVNTANVTGSDAWNQSANDASKVFDGDLASYFDGVGNGWVQADLGGLYQLDAIGYCPRKGYEYRCTDGYFSVSADGINWTTVYTVKGQPSYAMHYVQDIAEDLAVRYVRYQVPEGAPQNIYNKDNVYCCNIAEIELYGKPIAAAAGDVNGDGAVTAADAVSLLKYLLTEGTLGNAEAADLNADGRITGADFSLLKRRLLGADA